MDNDHSTFFIIMATIVCMYFLGGYVGEHDANQLKAECEKTLPRGETCKIIAVPENGE